jgi:hypothetical protein
MNRILRTIGPAAVLLAGAATTLLAAPSASATGNEGPQCVNALIAANNANSNAIGADDEGNPSAAATDDATTGGYLYTAEQTCYYTPSYTAYQDVIQATVDNGSAKSDNSSGNGSAGLSEEDAGSSLINTAMNIEMGYGYL